jgi:hypothetical protein
MSTPITIPVHTLIGHLAISVHDGERVHHAIASALQQHHSVIVDFASVTILTTAFLNSAIGQLYGTFSPDTLSTNLIIRNLDESDQELLQLVIRNAQDYFINRRVRDTVDTIVQRYRETGET